MGPFPWNNSHTRDQTWSQGFLLPTLAFYEKKIPFQFQFNSFLFNSICLLLKPPQVYQLFFDFLSILTSICFQNPMIFGSVIIEKLGHVPLPDFKFFKDTGDHLSVFIQQYYKRLSMPLANFLSFLYRVNVSCRLCNFSISWHFSDASASAASRILFLIFR